MVLETWIIQSVHSSISWAHIISFPQAFCSVAQTPIHAYFEKSFITVGLCLSGLLIGSIGWHLLMRPHFHVRPYMYSSSWCQKCLILQVLVYFLLHTRNGIGSSVLHAEANRLHRIGPASRCCFHLFRVPTCVHVHRLRNWRCEVALKRWD